MERSLEWPNLDNAVIAAANQFVTVALLFVSLCVKAGGDISIIVSESIIVLVDHSVDGENA